MIDHLVFNKAAREMRYIRCFCVISFLLLVLLVVFPESKFHFAYLSGFFGAVAGLVSVAQAYRTQTHVSTRGGIIEKDENPAKYAVPHVVMAVFFCGLIFFFVLGSLGMIS